MEVASVCLQKLAPIYSTSMAVLKRIRYSCVSDVPCSSLRSKGKRQKLPCTIVCVLSIGSKEKTVNQLIKLLLFQVLVIL